MGGDPRPGGKAGLRRPLLAAALGALLVAAPAAAAENPRSFVERLYAGYRNPDFSPFDRPDRIFTPAFVAAAKEDWRLSRGEVGFLDADPLCQCQDASGMKAEIARVERRGPAAAEARLRLRFPGPEVRDVRLQLVLTRAGWRVGDIAAEGEASFLRSLQAWNRRKRARGR